MAKRVIFLDIDGPIISPKNLSILRKLDMMEDYEGQKPPEFKGMTAEFLKVAQSRFEAADPIAVMYITMMAVKANAKIVISSTWRSHGYDNFVESFEDFGFDKDLLHDDWLTTKGYKKRRELEIQDWLARHPEVERFVTIDDELLDFDSHIQVCATNGFLFDNYEQGLELLNEADGMLGCNVYSNATVDWFGPEEMKQDSPRLQRCVKRLQERRDSIKERYKNIP